jgi:hypothetical protein
MAQQNLNSNKKKKNAEQQKETPVKLQLNKKDSQKEFEYANDSFENPD